MDISNILRKKGKEQENEKKEKNIKTVSLKKRLLLLFGVFWLIPVFVIFIFVMFSYRSSVIEKTETAMKESLRNFNLFVAQNINESVRKSRNVSYELKFETWWKQLDLYITTGKGDMTRSKFQSNVKENLMRQIGTFSEYNIAVFYLTDDPDNLYYVSKNGSGYLGIYEQTVKQHVTDISKMDSNDTHIKAIDDQVYIIRNLYTTTNYTKFGTLLLGINKTRFFNDYFEKNINDFGFYINDEETLIDSSGELKMEGKQTLLSELRKASIGHLHEMQKKEVRDYQGFVYREKFNDYTLTSVLVSDKNNIYTELKAVYAIISVILVVMIPIFIYMLYFISRHITIPMSKIIKASKAIEKGKIGTQVEELVVNEEFRYLSIYFNKMSSKVKYLFDYAYNEKLARKDAKIIALQSQINPHFLNNTLEMMNWQARMAGDITVSKMIEALSILLDYSMDRTSKKRISLSEELRCADAYFYIISMRFGQRLHFEKEIDQSLLQYQVPQLILQPILENAVVHGVERVKNGTIFLKVYRKDYDLILEVTNTGKGLTEEDLEKIKLLLSDDYKPDSSTKHVSLGIRNVNERLKLIYGEDYGLIIEPGEDTLTISRITIPIDESNDRDKEKMLKRIMEK